MMLGNTGFLDLRQQYWSRLCLGQYCCLKSIKFHIALITGAYLYNMSIFWLLIRWQCHICLFIMASLGIVEISFGVSCTSWCIQNWGSWTFEFHSTMDVIVNLTNKMIVLLFNVKNLQNMLSPCIYILVKSRVHSPVTFGVEKPTNIWLALEWTINSFNFRDFVKMSHDINVMLLCDMTLSSRKWMLLLMILTKTLNTETSQYCTIISSMNRVVIVTFCYIY